MPSKYQQKQRKPSKLPGYRKEWEVLFDKPAPFCPNCGYSPKIRNLSHTKCRCGGTYQTFGA